jgi:hypothetical protein
MAGAGRRGDHRRVTPISLRDLVRRLAGPTYPLPARRVIDCPICAGELVIPVRWEARDERAWWIRLRCGECTNVREVELSDDAAHRYERDLDVGVREIAVALAKAERARMRADAALLAAALERDLIGPADFGVPS